MLTLSQVVVVVGVIVAAASLRLLSGRGFGIGGRVGANSAVEMRCVGRLVLSSQHALRVVDIEGRRLVLALHPGGCRVIASLRSDGEVETARSRSMA